MCTKRRRGFTLVELLVVIGIIAVLIGILLPSLNKARQQANTLKCLSNLRQMALGCTLYMNDWKGVLPPSRQCSPTNANYTPGGMWLNKLNEGGYLKAPGGGRIAMNAFVCPNAIDGVSSVYADFYTYGATNGPTSRSQNVGNAYFQGSDVISGSPHYYSTDQDLLCSYGVNGFNAQTPTPTQPPFSNYGNGRPNGNSLTEDFPFFYADPQTNPTSHAANMFRCKDSSHTGLIYDGYWLLNLNPGCMQLRHGSQSGKENSRQCNWVFVDGHAESIPGSSLPGSGLAANSNNMYYDGRFLMQTGDSSAGFYAVKFCANP